jgi:hypothetical protein
MKLLLALVALVFAAGLFTVGTPPLVLGDPEVARGDVLWMARGGLPPTDYLHLESGVFARSAAAGEHVIGEHVYLPLLAPAVATAATAGGGFDGARALGAGEADRIFVARVPTAALREAVTEAGIASEALVLAPFEVRGTLEPLAQWPAAAQRLITARLGIPAERAYCIAHGKLPLTRIGGAIATACALALVALAWRLWRSRHRVREPGSGLLGRAAVTLGGVVAALGLLFARFGDDLARHSDGAVSARAARQSDSLAAKGAKAAVGEPEPFERLLEGLDLALDLQQAAELHAFLTDVFGADTTVLWTTAITDVRENYTHRADGAYELTTLRVARRRSIARDGASEPTEAVIDTELPEPSKGEFVRLRLAPPDGLGGPARLHHTLRWDGQAPAVEIAAEVEPIEGSWLGFAQGQTLTLRYTPAGRAALAAGTARAYRDAAVRAAKHNLPDAQRVEAEARIPHLADLTITIDSATAHVRSAGTTVMQVSTQAWRTKPK